MSGMTNSGSAILSATALTIGVVAVAAGVLMMGPRRAVALPSYARQTGQQCAACHNGFPELTPYGRLFKLNGYTFGGGSSDLPPVSVMSLNSFNHTQASQPGGAAQHFGPNDNLASDQSSLFYGGAITDHLGAFAQVTYDGVGRVFSWDNTDIRYARTATIAGTETILGMSLNNNPTVQDVWNTTPAWGFPFVSSKLSPTPSASTMLEGGFAQQVAGLTAYTYWNRLIYLEVGGYRTLSPGVQSAFGAFSTGNSGINGIAPYWRAAVQRDWDRNSLEAGVFGMAASIQPQRLAGFGADHVTDVGLDAQYQFLADRNSISVQASAIFENQNLSASANPALGLASNSHNTLRSLHAKTTYFYDQTYGATLGAFRVEGTPDAALYPNAVNGSPNSTGITSELDYIPFNHGGPDFWPWFNLKLGLQYVYYTQFDGATGRAAHNNNTLYSFVWFAF
jgi:hypothetical protein